MADAKPRKNADLPVRVVSALVMVLIAGAALGLGGWVWSLFVLAVGAGIIWEWWGLVRSFVTSATGRALWLISGLVYVGLGVSTLLVLRHDPTLGWPILLAVVLGVIGTDIGAYFTGRTFGGPKIAPAISPSKTWSGLGGGMLGAATGIYLAMNIAASERFAGLVSEEVTGSAAHAGFFGIPGPSLLGCLVGGAVLAVIAQAGDFFESWMKRRAGVKDSGKLIPGHGGLFDRTDGFLAVLFIVGILAFAPLLLAAGRPA